MRILFAIGALESIVARKGEEGWKKGPESPYETKCIHVYEEKKKEKESCEVHSTAVWSFFTGRKLELNSWWILAVKREKVVEQTRGREEEGSMCSNREK